MVSHAIIFFYYPGSAALVPVPGGMCSVPISIHTQGGEVAFYVTWTQDFKDIAFGPKPPKLSLGDPYSIILTDELLSYPP